MSQVLPFLQQLNSASSLCTVSFSDLFFSFSFSYFLFHCSAVSSRFTVTVFRIVFALIGWIKKRRKKKSGGKGMEWGENRRSEENRREKLLQLELFN